jgi:hypothetical protein
MILAPTLESSMFGFAQMVYSASGAGEMAGLRSTHCRDLGMEKTLELQLYVNIFIQGYL